MLPTERGLVLVTGASGFVGSAIVRALLERGYGVRALLRPTSTRSNVDGLPIDIALGDVRDPANLAAALRGVRYVVHAAADYRLWSPRPEELVACNVEGTINVMRAALASAVERIVYTSSVATLAPRRDGKSANETMRLSVHDAIGPYKRSKVLAEQAVDDFVEREKLPAVIVQPSTPIGPRDIKPTPTGRVILEAAAGRMPAYVDTGLNLVHVDDVAKGHVAALERGKIGEHYILGGQNATLQRMLRDIANLVGRAPPRLPLPRRLLYPAAMITQGVARWTGREPLLTVDGLRMARHRMFFTSVKAEREIGYWARPYVQGLADAIAWFREAGKLR